MLRVAAREGYKVTIPSFEALIIRTERGGRALLDAERKKLSAEYAPWMQRLSDFANETCLSLGDLLRLTDEMIDRKTGVVFLEGGRGKTKSEQTSPLTVRARQILDEIKAERKSGAAVPNVNALIFTNADGRSLTKGQIEYQVERALKKTGVRKFTFHNYRNTALTRWARQGINVDVAMRASGHSSVQMHKRYVDLQREDIAKAFGIELEMATEIATEQKTVNRK